MKNSFRRLALLLAAVVLSPLFAVCAQADYTIYPVPQKMSSSAGSVLLTANVNVVADKGIDSYTLARLEEVLSKENGLTVSFSGKAKAGCSNVWLGIQGSKGAAAKRAAKSKVPTDVFAISGKFDRHVLTLSTDGAGLAEIIILGEHTNAVFYALATLEQMLEQASGRSAECITMQ